MCGFLYWQAANLNQKNDTPCLMRFIKTKQFYLQDTPDLKDLGWHFEPLVLLTNKKWLDEYICFIQLQWQGCGLQPWAAFAFHQWAKCSVSGSSV